MGEAETTVRVGRRQWRGQGVGKGAGAPPEQDAQGGMVPRSPRNRSTDHGVDAEETNDLGQNHVGVPLHVV